MKLFRVSDIVDMIEGRMNNKFDCITFISGERGSGKSTLAFKIAMGLKKREGITFRPKKNTVYSREDTLKLLATETKNVILSDELVNVAYSRDFYEAGQKQLLKALNMYRDSCNCFIGAIPYFNTLDVQIRQLCALRIHIIKRGQALVMMRFLRVFEHDVWDTKENIRIETKGKFGKTRYGKLSTVVGVLRFRKLSKQQSKTYERIKKRKRGKVFSELDRSEAMMNPQEKMINNMVDKMVAGEVDYKSFNTFLKLSGLKRTALTRKINAILMDHPKSEGKTFSKFIKKPNVPKEEKSLELADI